MALCGCFCSCCYCAQLIIWRRDEDYHCSSLLLYFIFILSTTRMLSMRVSKNFISNIVEYVCARRNTFSSSIEKCRQLINATQRCDASLIITFTIGFYATFMFTFCCTIFKVNESKLKTVKQFNDATAFVHIKRERFAYIQHQRKWIILM